MVSSWHRLQLALLATSVLVTPCGADEAISRAATVRNVPDVPPGPIVEALSRPLTLYNLPDVPPPPIAQAASRALTVYALPDSPPAPISAAISRPVTVSNWPDPPPDPIREAFSRSLTVRNQPDAPPDPITAAISRPLTVRVDPLTHAAPDRIMAFALHGARPNPFNPSTTIHFEVPRDAKVWIRIYNVRGALVAELLDGVSRSAGRHEVEWQGRDVHGRRVASGTYLCRMTAEGFSSSVSMTLVK